MAAGRASVVATTALALGPRARLHGRFCIFDEAWQMTNADLGGLGPRSAQVVLVGDPEPDRSGGQWRYYGRCSRPAESPRDEWRRCVLVHSCNCHDVRRAQRLRLAQRFVDIVRLEYPLAQVPNAEPHATATGLHDGNREMRADQRDGRPGLGLSARVLDPAEVDTAAAMGAASRRPLLDARLRPVFPDSVV